MRPDPLQGRRRAPHRPQAALTCPDLGDLSGQTTGPCSPAGRALGLVVPPRPRRRSAPTPGRARRQPPPVRCMARRTSFTDPKEDAAARPEPLPPRGGHTAPPPPRAASHSPLGPRPPPRGWTQEQGPREGGETVVDPEVSGHLGALPLVHFPEGPVRVGGRVRDGVRIPKFSPDSVGGRLAGTSGTTRLSPGRKTPPRAVRTPGRFSYDSWTCDEACHSGGVQGQSRNLSGPVTAGVTRSGSESGKTTSVPPGPPQPKIPYSERDSLSGRGTL